MDGGSNCVCHGSRLAESPASVQAAGRVLAVAVAVAAAVMEFDYSRGPRPPSDPQCIPVASFKESHGLRIALMCRAMPGTSPRSGLSRTFQGAPALRRRDRLPASASTAPPHWLALLLKRRRCRRARR